MCGICATKYKRSKKMEGGRLMREGLLCFMTTGSQALSDAFLDASLFISSRGMDIGAPPIDAAAYCTVYTYLSR